MTTGTLTRRLAQLEAARRAERDALAWPELLALWRAGQDAYDFAGGAAWRDMVEQRRREVDQTLLDYEHENTVSPY